MQTLVSGVNSVTAVASQDLLEHSRLRHSQEFAHTNQGRLVTARVLTVVLGLSTTLIALGAARFAEGSGMNIFELIPPAFNVFLGPLGALFLIGMFQPRVKATTAFLATIAAMVVSFLWNYDTLLFGKQFDLSMCGAISVPCSFGFVFAALLSLVLDRGGDHPGRRFTWRAVMQRPVPQPHTAERQ